MVQHEREYRNRTDDQKKDVPVEMTDCGIFLMLATQRGHKDDSAKKRQADAQPEWKITRTHAGWSTHVIRFGEQGKAHADSDKHDSCPEILLIFDAHILNLRFYFPLRKD